LARRQQAWYGVPMPAAAPRWVRLEHQERRARGSSGPERSMPPDEVTGLFGPDSITWRLTRENVLVIGGGRALVLQVAHPLVGAGVADHSNYRQDPWGRLFRTLDTTTAVVFGSREEAQEAAGRVWNVHGRVRGKTDQNAGRYPRGTRYDARDPDLAKWVHATLIDTTLTVYDRFVRRLSLAEREGYFEEQKVFGEMFGVPGDEQPETYAEFNDYFDHMVEHELTATEVVRDVLDSIVNAELPPPATRLSPLVQPIFAPVRLATVGLLPERLRHELGLSWGPRRERALAAEARAVRALLPLLPTLVREFPRARAAERRLQLSEGSAGMVASTV
jgi:uncharacterized protein (DUF2236 family)